LTRKLITTFAALAVAALALAACGSDDGTTSTDTAAATTDTTAETTAETGGGATGAGGTIKIEADPGGQLAYTTGDLETKAGVVTIDFDNPSTVDHDVRIEDSSGSDLGGTSVITESSETAEVELEPGTYTYYCSVPGHRQAGMEATLTVK
jgi:plastocyanin